MSEDGNNKGHITIRVQEKRATLKEVLDILERCSMSPDILEKIHGELRGVFGKEFSAEPEETEDIRIGEEIVTDSSNLTFLSIDEMAEILYKTTQLQEEFSAVISSTIESLAEKRFEKTKSDLTTEEKIDLSREIIAGIETISEASGKRVSERLLSQLALRIIG